jgi:hypothetical protein
MLKALAVQFLYLEIYGVRKWGKTKERGGLGYEANTCFMARDISENISPKSLDRCNTRRYL